MIDDDTYDIKLNDFLMMYVCFFWHFFFSGEIKCLYLFVAFLLVVGTQRKESIFPIRTSTKFRQVRSIRGRRSWWSPGFTFTFSNPFGQSNMATENPPLSLILSPLKARLVWGSPIMVPLHPHFFFSMSSPWIIHLYCMNHPFRFHSYTTYISPYLYPTYVGETTTAAK